MKPTEASVISSMLLTGFMFCMIADFKRKQKKIPSAYFLLTLSGILILFVFLLFIIITNVRIYRQRAKLIEQVKNLENKIQDIKNKNNNLKQGILKSNDDEHIEKVAREELDLQKPGEKVFSFIMPQNQQAKIETDKKYFWQNWLGWLGKLFSFD